MAHDPAAQGTATELAQRINDAHAYLRHALQHGWLEADAPSATRNHAGRADRKAARFSDTRATPGRRRRGGDGADSWNGFNDPRATERPVVSSNVRSVGYVADTRTLYVRFRSGSVYDYEDVGPEVWEGLLSATSPGSFLNRYVIHADPYDPVVEAARAAAQSASRARSGKPPSRRQG